MVQRRRGVALAAACVGATVLLVGCTPPILGVAGLERVGDEFRVVVMTCEGYTLPEVKLLDRSQVNDRQEFAGIASWPLGDEQNRIVEAQVPSGALDHLIAGNEYMLSGTGEGLVPWAVTGPVFTTSDVEQLRDAEVLTVDTANFESIVLMNRSEMAAVHDGLLCG